MQIYFLCAGQQTPAKLGGNALLAVRGMDDERAQQAVRRVKFQTDQADDLCRTIDRHQESRLLFGDPLGGQAGLYQQFHHGREIGLFRLTYVHGTTPR